MDTNALHLDCKAIVTVENDGDLLLEGWAARWEGIDRQNENFAPGCFRKAIAEFLEGSAVLAYHHKHDQILGKVLELEEVEGKGLRMRARVDGAIRNHPVLGTIYQQIKNETLQNLSLGGFFKRIGNKIVDVDLTDCSVTGVPVHRKPAFAVIAGKAMPGGATDWDQVQLAIAAAKVSVALYDARHL